MTSLQERYNDEKIKEADERKKKLSYKKIHVGLNNHERVDLILRLLFQTHQNYYFGHFDASAMLSGLLVEQSLTCLLQEEVERKGSISYKWKGTTSHANDIEDILNLNLITLIKTARYHNIIGQADYKLATSLRIARNHLMHNILPPFEKNTHSFSSMLLVVFRSGDSASHVVNIPVGEVSRHCMTEASDELWAYYMLTRTRKFMGNIFQERVHRLPPQ